MSELDDKNERKPSILVYFAVLFAQMGSMSLGCCLGWSGPALEDMGRSDSIPQLTNSADDLNVKSWVASSMTVGALIGGILSGFCIKFLGYKKTMIFLGIPYTVGWVCLGKAWILILGRIITGTSTGIMLGVVPAYVVDISTPNIRGLLGMAMNVFVVAGILYMDFLLLWMPWNYASLAGIIPSILLSASMFFMPDSPNFLMTKFGRTLNVVEAMHRLRSPNSDIEKELNELEEVILSRKSQSNQGFNYKMLLRQDVYKPMGIAVLLLFFQQFSGLNAIQFYMPRIFEDSGSSLKASYAVITVNTVMLFATILGGLLVDRLGRKYLLAFSGLCHTISIGVLGYYYYKHRTIEWIGQTTNSTSISTTLASTTSTMSQYFYSPVETHETSVVPIICLGVFFIGFSLGYGTVSWVVITEICSANVVGYVVPFASSICWLFAFIVSKEFQDISDVATTYGTYWIFSGISALSVLFALYLPETKGKTAEEIQKIYYPKIYTKSPINYYKKPEELKQFPRTEVTAL